MIRFFPINSLADIFIFGGFYYEGDIGYLFPIPESKVESNGFLIFMF
jgi:hypothetical protein